MSSTDNHDVLTHAEAVGSALMWCRKMRRMSRHDLADATEMGYRTLGAIEAGEREARAGELMAFAHVLNIPLGWLENPPVPATVEVTEPAATLGGSGA